jgi:hypothetical protein
MITRELNEPVSTALIPRWTAIRRLLCTLVPLVTAAWLGCGPQGSGGRTDTRALEEVQADSIVDAWISAAGGLEAWHDVTTLRYTVTTVWYDSTGGIRRMRPRRVTLRKTTAGEQSRIERPEAEGLYVQVFADQNWATLNDARLPQDHPAAAEVEYVGRDVFYWIGLPYKLRDPGVNRRATQLEQGGWEVLVTFGAGVGVHSGDRYFYYFEDEDPFPEEVHYIEEGREEKDRNRTEWSAFQRADPITYVGRRLWRNALGVPTKELRIHDVWVNPDLPDELFQPPGP